MKKIVVAQIIGKWLGGGVESVVMNYYRNIDKSKIQFDFICDSDSTNIPYDEIEKLGGKVILIPPYQKIFKYMRVLKKVLKENNYKIVHSHLNALSVFPLYVAKKAGVPIRIAHSHSTSNKIEWKKDLIKRSLKIFSKCFATDYFACTEHAGKWLFGKKCMNNGLVYLLNNAIDLDKYKYNENIRKKVRKDLTIDDNCFVIGHIGRFVKQKNHDFLIDVFNNVHQKNKETILLLIGQGPLENNIRQKVERLNLNQSVMFLNQRDDVNQLYQAMDLFLFPSLYEGLGMVLVEAQCSGLCCIASSEVPNITKINENVEFIDLDDSINVWTNKIINSIKSSRKCNLNKFTTMGYDIKNETKKLEIKYQMMSGDYNEQE